MKAILAATLTGSCALIYFLYHLNSNSKGRKEQTEQNKMKFKKERLNVYKQVKDTKNESNTNMVDNQNDANLKNSDNLKLPNIIEVKDPNSNLLLKEEKSCMFNDAQKLQQSDSVVISTSDLLENCKVSTLNANDPCESVSEPSICENKVAEAQIKVMLDNEHKKLVPQDEGSCLEMNAPRSTEICLEMNAPRSTEICHLNESASDSCSNLSNSLSEQNQSSLQEEDCVLCSKDDNIENLNENNLILNTLSSEPVSEITTTLPSSSKIGLNISSESSFLDANIHSESKIESKGCNVSCQVVESKNIDTIDTAKILPSVSDSPTKEMTSRLSDSSVDLDSNCNEVEKCTPEASIKAKTLNSIDPNTCKKSSNKSQKNKINSKETENVVIDLKPKTVAKNSNVETNRMEVNIASPTYTIKLPSVPINEDCLPSKSKKQRRKAKRNARLKAEKESEQIALDKLSEASKESSSDIGLTFDSTEKSANKLSIEERLNPTSNSGSSFNSLTCTPSPDLICTSDLERECSQTPEHENITSDSQSLISQASLDSGQGSIEIDRETLFSCITLPENSSEQYVLYQFEVPQLLVGKLIGRKGVFLNKVKAATSTSIVLLEHANDELKLCALEGKKWQVLQALDMIREHFPSDQFPDLTLTEVNTPFPSPQHQPQVNRQILQVELPPGVVLEVQASAVISTGEVWLQQPLHPTFSALQRLHQLLNVNYEDGSTTPVLPLPIPTNTICVCKFGGQWLRCQVIEHDDVNCTVLLLDVGGCVPLPIDLLRQIRVDYIGLPFQATQCFLYGIEPNTEQGWEDSGRFVLEELVKNNIIYSAIAAYSQDGIPLVNLYQRQYNNQYTFINERLVDLGHAKWISSEMSPTREN